MPAAAETTPQTGLKRLRRWLDALAGRPCPDAKIIGHRHERPIPSRRVDPSTIARGFHDPGNRPGLKRVVVTVDEAMFDLIRRRATHTKTSFAAVTRELIARGIAADEPPSVKE